MTDDDRKKLAEIEARHDESARLFEPYGRHAIVFVSGPKMHDDRAWLLAALKDEQKLHAEALVEAIDRLCFTHAQENAKRDAREARLREALTDCAHDLECEINADFPESVRVYPVMQAKYEREMSTVYEARAALKDTQP